MAYGIHSRDYLKRAESLLNSGMQDALFYAAFELRCGIEARLQEYVSVQERISEKKKQGWRVAQLSKDLESAFNTGDRIANVKVRSRNTEAVLQDFYFTPVTAELRKMAGRLGVYLHSRGKYHRDEDSWWQEFRDYLESVYLELRTANSGTLLGPPMLHPETSQIKFVTEMLGFESDPETVDNTDILGTPVFLEVKYLDRITDSLLREAKTPGLYLAPDIHTRSCGSGGMRR